MKRRFQPFTDEELRHLWAILNEIYSPMNQFLSDEIEQEQEYRKK